MLPRAGQESKMFEMKPQNLFCVPPSPTGGEVVHTLLEDGVLRVERILSNGCSSPEGFWYDQEQSEWVVLIQGTAVLRFEDNRTVELVAGDYVVIQRHTKHRVEEVSDDALWLAVHHG
jgi:cupin 2 domain-containing protein